MDKKNNEKVSNNDTKFPIKSLQDNCKKLFDVDTGVFKGAFIDVKEEKVTILEAKDIIDKWMKREVL